MDTYFAVSGTTRAYFTYPLLREIARSKNTSSLIEEFSGRDYLSVVLKFE